MGPAFFNLFAFLVAFIQQNAFAQSPSSLHDDFSDSVEYELDDAFDETALLQVEQSTDKSSAKRCTKLLMPTVFLMGLPHGGSTSFATALNEHPMLSWGDRKEHLWWESRFMGESVDSNISTYLSEFEVDCNVKYTFDANSRIIYFGNPNANENEAYLQQYAIRPGVFGVNAISRVMGSNSKFVLLIRDPIDQLYSFFGMKKGAEIVLDPGYHWVTCLADSLRNWLKVFPRSSFLFLKSEDFFDYPDEELAKATDFLGVPRFDSASTEATGRRRTSTEAVITTEMRQEFHMREANQKCKRELEEMTQMQFTWPFSP